MYASDFDDRFQPSANWADAIQPYTKNKAIFTCPVVKEQHPDGFGYAFNAVLSGAKVAVKAASTTPLVYESSSIAWQTSDPFTSLPNPGRHVGSDPKIGRNNIGYADGHAKGVPNPPLKVEP